MTATPFPEHGIISAAPSGGPCANGGGPAASGGLSGGGPCANAGMAEAATKAAITIITARSEIIRLNPYLPNLVHPPLGRNKR